MGYESNIRRFYLYRIFQSLAFVSPIFVLFMNENGLSLAQVMLLQALFLVIVTVLEIPSGAFADKFGRKASILISSIILFFACAIYSMGHSFAVFLLAEVLWGIGSALYSGADSAFIYDTLIEIKKEKEYKRIEGNAFFFMEISLAAAALFAPLIFVHGYRLTFYATLIPFFIAAIIPMTFKETSVHKSEKNYLRHMKSSTIFSFRHPRIRFFLIYSAFLYTISFAVFWLHQPYFISLGIPVKFNGILYFFVFLLAGLGGKYAYKIETNLGEKPTLFLMLFSIACACFLAAFIRYSFSVIFLFIINFVYGLSMPLISNYINEHTPSAQRATVVSVSSFCANILFVFIGPLTGKIADQYSLTSAFLLNGLFCTVGIIFLYLSFKKKSPTEAMENARSKGQENN